MTRLRSVQLLGFATAWIVAACSGGGGGGGGVSAPSGLTYATPPTYVVNQAISPLTPTVSGTVSNYAVSPALPAGLSISASSGTISGTPTAVSASATYTVTASNSAGATSASLTIAVNDTAPKFTYASTGYTFTAGIPGQTDAPSSGGGTVLTWSVSPSLPAGLSLDTSSGAVHGVPTATSAAATYVVSATNSGGTVTFPLSIAVAHAPLLSLGHAASIQLLRDNGSNALSQDSAGHWNLWNIASSTILASGDSAAVGGGSPATYYPADMAGATVALQTPSGFTMLSATSGQQLSTITATPTWWKLATDGSYLCAGSTAGLTAWTPTGSLLFTRAGDYSKAIAFAAPGAPGTIQVANGPAGQSVIESINVITGASTVSATYQGTFLSWFTDGSSFLSASGQTVWVYSPTASQREIVTVPTATSITTSAGLGSWFWTWNNLAGIFSVYAVGGSSTPTASYSLHYGAVITPAGSTVGLLDSVGHIASVLDLSGAMPVKTDTASPLYGLSAYSAVSPNAWIVGNSNGVIVDGTTLATQPRYFNEGAIIAVAGSATRAAVATAAGHILYFDAATTQLAGTINARANDLGLSSDGTVLLAYDGDDPLYGDQFPSTYSTSIYALPAATLTTSFTNPAGCPGLQQSMTLSGSGTTVGALVGGSGETLSASGSGLLWCSTVAVNKLALSPDGTQVAASYSTTSGTSTAYYTNIYLNGTLITTVNGWVLGWIANDQLLVANVTTNATGTAYTGSVVYNGSGTSLSQPSLPQIQPPATGQAPIGTIPGANAIYAPAFPAVYAVTSGAETWTTASPPVPSGASVGLGAVMGGNFLFASGPYLLAEPYFTSPPPAPAAVGR